MVCSVVLGATWMVVRMCDKNSGQWQEVYTMQTPDSGGSLCDLQVTFYNPFDLGMKMISNEGCFGGSGAVLCPLFEVEHP